MRKRMIQFAGATLALILCAAPVKIQARAAQDISIAIPFTVLTEGIGEGEQTDFSVCLTGKDKAPMPAEADGTDTWTQKVTVQETGEESFSMPAISFAQPGIYRYTIKQILTETKEWQMDPTIYQITVRILYTDNGLVSEVVAENNGAKTAPVFENIRRQPAVTPVVPDGGKDASKEKKTDSIQTGDRSGGWYIWALLAAAACAGIALTIITGYRRRKRLYGTQTRHSRGEKRDVRQMKEAEDHEENKA